VPLEPLDFNPDIVCGRLAALGTAPCLIGFSGGGDSTALLLIAARWARQCDVSLIPVIIDHALRPESAREAEAAASRARQLGLNPEIVRWEGDKPASGIQAVARTFRLQTFARMARDVNAQTILLGHTLDDQAETVWMRLQAGGGPDALAGMSARSPLPLWPEGMALSIVRPLLDVSRAALRNWLSREGQSWIDDPSNESRNFTRIRNRQTLAQLSDGGFDVAELCAMAGQFQASRRSGACEAAAVLLKSATLLPWGGIRLDRGALCDAADRSAQKAMEAARAAVSGDPSPRTDAARRLLEALKASASATAGGAALTVFRGEWWLVRDPGAVAGRADQAAAPVRAIPLGTATIWDGRFAFTRPDLEISLLGKTYPTGITAETLKAVPALARPGLPLIRQGGQLCGIPGLSGSADKVTQSLAKALIRRNLFEDRPPAWFDEQLHAQTAQGSH
jgi:tRNA(Ile)-lysidine synthase